MEHEKLLMGCVAGGIIVGMPFYGSYGFQAIAVGAAIGLIFFMQMRNYIG